MSISAESIGLRRDDTIPATAKTLWITRLKAGQCAEVIACGAAIWGTWTHWTGNMSEPCYQPKLDCPGCKRGFPHRWKGFLHCKLLPTWTETFLELPPLSARTLMDALPKDQPLRGSVIAFTRSSKTGKGPIFPVIKTTRIEEEKLPQPKDPIIVLAKLWGLSDLPSQNILEQVQ